MNAEIADLLKRGGIGVMPTDTIYGIVGSALSQKTVEEIYRIRRRDQGKPMIILISSLLDLEKFQIVLSVEQRNFLKRIWPNPVSVILPCLQEKFTYLHRGKKSLAFRIPKNKKMLFLLKETGPLVAPSVNFADKKPAETIKEAKSNFGDTMSFYIDGGRLQLKPSTVVRLYEDGKYMIVREGTHKL